MKKINAEELLEIGISLSSEKDRNKLFYLIIDNAMKFTGCDGGTLYVCSKENLIFKIMITKSQQVSMGARGEIIDIPPVPMSQGNVCACCAMTRNIINVPDVYKETEYDFSGPRKYDAITGYHTQSMLVVPMEDDRGDIIGVLQLINAQNDDGEIIAFDKESEILIKCLASQTAISLTNVNYAKELEELLDSFVRVMSAAIDARTPYNANHTRNMAKYGKTFLSYLDETEHPWRFKIGKQKEFMMSIWLHDIGKLVTPLNVMNKESRIGGGMERVEQRFREIELLGRLSLAEGKISLEVFESLDKEIKESIAFLKEIDRDGFLPDDKISRVEEISSRFYENEKGEKLPWLTAHEKDCFSIRKGTLLEEERRIMEEHVVMTNRFLKEIEFNREYKDVLYWASKHHEFLNGTGYPEGLSGEEVEPEVRLLTILDIFDSLTASDRPYKPAMSVEGALSILDSMAEEGKLDKDILILFKESKAWEKGERNEVGKEIN